MSIAPEQTWQEAIGGLFTARRDKLGIPNHEVAFRARQRGVVISPDVVGRIMRGERTNPSPVHLGAIASVLGIDQAEWMGLAMSTLKEPPEEGNTRTTCYGDTQRDQQVSPDRVGVEHTLAVAA